MKRVYALMKVVSVGLNNDKPSYWGKYKIGYTHADGRTENVTYEYGDVHYMVGDTFKQEVTCY